MFAEVELVFRRVAPAACASRPASPDLNHNPALMRLETWILFVITEAVLSATPGPAVLFVLSQAIRRGPAKSVWASIGILSANTVYFTLSATSLGAIIVASYDLFFLIKWAGAAYLVYLGLQCFFGKTSMLSPSEEGNSGGPTWRICVDGFMLQGANPKTLLFFTAILPQFIDPKSSIGVQILILGMSSLVVEFFILFIYGQLAGRTARAVKSPRFGKLSSRIAGFLLISAGLGLARLKRT
jgi:homoserine/homoserine lactone efflux protein